MKVMSGLAVAMLSSMAMATPALAGASNGPSAATAEPQHKAICKRDLAVGTRLAKRVCRTKAEWKELEAQHSENKRILLDRQGEEFIPGDKPL